MDKENKACLRFLSLEKRTTGLSINNRPDHLCEWKAHNGVYI